ncbi:uncharacterized protein LOC129754256 [Uranotaenia lowii]|uniref:uncharacterized protein LOC129754256 n=1 Tax=Uranotaenia lowii TaxID=190385 RepID=UPI002478D6D6|nr:uncharacterized protein LOC129754256 [Uranotaenia lowii]
MTSTKESKIPDWLNEQFFEDIFVEKHQLPQGSFSVKIKAIIPTGGAGENYTSMLYRAKVDAVCDDGSTKTLALIIKAMFTAPEFKMFSVFIKEKLAYETLLPTVSKLWAQAGEQIQFGPRCWKSVDGEAEILVLDDLCAAGYACGNRQKGADLAHAHVMLSKLAKFHAATAVDYRKNGPITELYDKGMVQEEGRAFFGQYIKMIVPVFLETFNSWPEGEKYKKIYEKSMDGMFEKLLEATQKDDEGFVCLCHGDVWTNNHMYSHTEAGDVKDALLIDFQGPFYGSPITDLLYYLISSTTLELKATKFDELVQFYHRELSESLKKLNYPKKIPTLRDLNIELLRRGYFAFQCTFGIMPIVLADKSENANFAGFVGEAEENHQFRHDVYNNPLFLEHLRALIKLFDVRGLLEFY